jgi:hypothetical protein
MNIHSAAVAAGLLTRNGDGSYSETRAGSSAGQEQAQQDQRQEQQEDQQQAASKVSDLDPVSHQLAQFYCEQAGDVLPAAVASVIKTGDLYPNSVLPSRPGRRRIRSAAMQPSSARVTNGRSSNSPALALKRRWIGLTRTSPG